MFYKKFCTYLSEIEKTKSRNKITEILVEMFKELSIDDVEYAVRLLEGKLHNKWENKNEINMANKMVLEAMGKICSFSKVSLNNKLKEYGDIGKLAFDVMKKKSQRTLFDSVSKGIKIKGVYDSLLKISNMSGAGSQKGKINELSALFTRMSSLESKYLSRIIVRAHRLGFQHQTILDALAILYLGSKKRKSEIETVYNYRPDLPLIIKKLMRFEEISEIKPTLFIPIKMMLAQRLETSKEILEKNGGKCVCEYKYDGIRLQIHKKGNKVVMFSRGLEDVSHQFPEIKKSVIENMKCDEIIFEGEVCAVSDIDEIERFQITVRRKRKHDIEKVMKDIPVKLFSFDLLYCDGEEYLSKSFYERREKLVDIMNENGVIVLSFSILVDSVEKMERLFYKAIEENTEGLMCKNIKSKYSAGSRGNDWVKMKASYQSNLQDTIDVVCMGAMKGSGRRTGKYGTIIAGIYDKNTGDIETLTKVGSGFADSVLDEMNIKFKILDKKPKNYISEFVPDFWFEPEYVMEIVGDEFTLSPSYSCGKGKVDEKRGLSLRFPRFKKWRDDKGIEDSTTSDEIIEMFEKVGVSEKYRYEKRGAK